MKKIIALLLLIALLVPAALAYDYNDPTLEEYEVKLAANQRVVYMYSKASSSGNPISNYKNGAVLKMITYNAGKNFSYVIGPDGKVGYVGTSYLRKLEHFDYDDPTYESYRVAATQNTFVYLYPVSNSNGNPDGKYDNGTVLKMLDYEASKDFARVLAPDGKYGYVSKTGIAKEKEDGSLGPVLEVFSVYATGYCYMYAKPNSGAKNLGRYNNGDQIEVIDWGADDNYAKVHGLKDDKYGYIEKKSMHAPGVSPVKGYMEVCAPGSYDYVYLYRKASDGSENLGRYDNGTQIGILDWSATELYALVYTPDEKIGYMKKDWLISLFQ